MGLEGDGMFNTQDYYDTKNAATAEEKKAVNEEKLRTRLEKLGIRGWLDLAGRKLVRTWADGTDDYPSYLNQYSSTGCSHTWLLEDKKRLRGAVHAEHALLPVFVHHHRFCLSSVRKKDAHRPAAPAAAEPHRRFFFPMCCGKRASCTACASPSCCLRWPLQDWKRLGNIPHLTGLIM